MEQVFRKLKDYERRIEALERLEFNQWTGVISHFLGLPGLRGFWPMSAFDGSGNIADISGNGNSLTRAGNPTFNYGGLMTYVDLDGTGDYYYHADSANFDILGTEGHVASAKRGLTFGSLFNPDQATPAANEVLISKTSSTAADSAYTIYRDTSGIFYGRIYNSSSFVTATGIALSEQWVLAVCRFNPSTEISIYLNGTWYPNTTSIPASINNSSAQFKIGDGGSGGSYFDGKVSLSFLCATYLSDDIISSLYQTSRKLPGV